MYKHVRAFMHARNDEYLMLANIPIFIQASNAVY